MSQRETVALGHQFFSGIVSMSIRVQMVVVLALTLVAGQSLLGAPQFYRLQETFRNDTPEEGDFFGTAVALEDGVAAIKSHSGYSDGDALTKTHIFERDGSGQWQRASILEFDDGSDWRGNFFRGQELDIDNGVVAIAYSRPNDRSRGAVSNPLRFATRGADGWTAVDGVPAERESFVFSGEGRVVGISGGVAVVPHPSAINDSGSSGAVLVYEQDSAGGWAETAALGPAASRVSRFDVDSVAMAESTIVAWNRVSSSSSSVPRLFFFEQAADGEWFEAASISQGELGGTAVKASGDVVVVGSVGSRSSLNLLERDSLGGWVAAGSIPPTTGLQRLGEFDIDGDLIARTFRGDAGERNFVEVYRRLGAGDWALIDTIFDPAEGINRTFGSSLSLSGNQLLIGGRAAFGVISDPAPGVAYLFVAVPEPSSLSLMAGFAVLGVLRRSRP